MTIQQELELIIKNRYGNYLPLMYRDIGILHDQLRKRIGDEEFLKLLRQSEIDNPRPKPILDI